MLMNKLAKSGKAIRKVEAPKPAAPSKIVAAIEADAGVVAADDEMEAALARYASLGDKMKVLEAKRDNLKVWITLAIEASGAKTLRGAKYQATYVAGARREKLEPKLLLQAGVTVAQIEKATVVTTGKPYVAVSEVRS